MKNLKPQSLNLTSQNLNLKPSTLLVLELDMEAFVHNNNMYFVRLGFGNL